MMKISPVNQAHSAHDKPKVDAKIERAAKEFETIFVRELLQAAKLGKEGGGASEYGSMAVDALANGIEAGGGLGLGRSLTDALAHHVQHRPAQAATPSQTNKVLTVPSSEGRTGRSI